MLKPEITVACIVEENGRYLLVEEKTETGIRLNQPAGHLEPGETVESGAVREAMEETACRVKPVALVAVNLLEYMQDGHESRSFLRFTFEAEFIAQTDAALDPDIIRTHWMTYEEILACKDRLRSHLVLDTIEAYRQGIRCPVSLLSSRIVGKE
ncbi:MAG: NUDIX hydrolase [Oxalobacter sp.]|nr:NUDIX hydrolase [Oxalobacter sp.]